MAVCYASRVQVRVSDMPMKDHPDELISGFVIGAVRMYNKTSIPHIRVIEYGAGWNIQQ